MANNHSEGWESGGVRERPAAGMAWAVKAKTRQPVYVGRLVPPEQYVGLKCDCECPACGAPLQAVNLREPAGSPKQPFFRHHVGTQGPGCKYRVAELAALKLLAEKGVIEIPALRRRGEREGLSGTIYQAEAVGTAIRERVVERRLVSEATAILTLESGRQVALVLRGHQDVGELGSVFAVVEVQVDDPEVAWLSPDEILKRSELQSKWLHVVRHEEDNELQVKADEMARQEALDKLDIDPRTLDLPVGATKKQASESLIHWAVKEALMQTGWLQAPELRLSASAVGRGGVVHTVPVTLPSARMRVEQVAAEVLFNGYRADIVCLVRDEADVSGEAFRLLVEVAVTNKVKPEKLRLIQDANTACIELDVYGFSRGGAVTRPQLRDLVARDVESKAWLYHPGAAALLSEAQQRANVARDLDDARRAEVARREADLRSLEAAKERQRKEREAAKVSWAAGLDDAAALQELRGALKQRWDGMQEKTSNGMAWAQGELESALGKRIPRGLTDSVVTRRGGLVWRLESIVYSGKRGGQPLDVRAVLGIGEALVPYDVEPWLGLLHMAVEEAHALIKDGRKGYEEQRAMVMKSLEAGDRSFARQTHLDEALGSMFPELAAVFAREIGTRAYSERVRREKEAERLRIEEQLRLEEEAAIAERKRQAAEAAAERERRRLPDAVEAVAYQWAWKTNSKVPKDAEEAVGFLKYTKHRDVEEPWKQLMRDGFAARGAGVDFGEWFRRRPFRSVDDVLQAREVLEAGWLVQSKLST